MLDIWFPMADSKMPYLFDALDYKLRAVTNSFIVKVEIGRAHV